MRAKALLSLQRKATVTLHRIRLRRPWQCEPAGEGACWRRRFHRPTGLGPDTQVWIVLGGFSAAGTMRLNGQALGRLDPERPECRFDATGAMCPENELAIDLDAPAPAALPKGADPPGEVALEIDRKRG